MKKRSPMHKARISSKAKEHLSKEKFFYLGLSALLVAIIINELTRSALLSW